MVTITLTDDERNALIAALNAVDLEQFKRTVLINNQSVEHVANLIISIWDKLLPEEVQG